MEEEEGFYGGAVGGGKTAALLMSALQYVDVPGYAALLLRRTYGELEQPDGLIPQSLRWFATAPEDIRPTYSKSDHEWTFPGGQRIVFGHLDNPNNMIRYQGGGYHMVGFDELTHFDEHSYEFIAFSRQRRPRVGPLSKVPMRIRATANPGGPGHIWVKRRFITKRKPDVAFVPAKMWDNPGIDSEDYARRLGKMDEVLRAQLLDGDWGAFEAAAFHKFSRDIHVVRPFDYTIPVSWDRFECMDYGISNATAWYLVAVDHEGNLIFVDSRYWENGALPSVSAPVILAARAAEWGRQHACYGDPNSLANRTGTLRKWGEPATVKTEFEDLGVHILSGDDNPRAGYVRLRELIEPRPERRFPDWHPRRGQTGAPRLYVVGERCRELVEQIESAPLQPLDKRYAGEMISPDWEGQHGHALAAARYGVMSRPAPTPKPPERLDDPRAELMRKLEQRENAALAGPGRYVDV